MYRPIRGIYLTTLTHLYLFLLPLHSFHSADSLKFTDITKWAGLSQPRGKTLKYGGALVADMNGDGWLDLLLSHHYSAPAELYLNGPGGFNFTRASWKRYGDIHGSTAFRWSPNTKGLSLLLQRGGGWGRNLKTPLMYDIDQRTNRVYTHSHAFPAAAGVRGRTACAISLRSNPHRNNSPRPDVILSSAYLLKSPEHQRVLEIRPGGRIVVRGMGGSFVRERNEFINVIDVDNDGQVEVVGFQALHIYKVNGDFSLRDITNAVLPKRRQSATTGRRNKQNQVSEYFTWRGVVAVAELDFNNDGRWDMYVARTTQQNMHWLPKNLNTDDILLRNIGGRFEDVSMRAGIAPFLGGYSRGVTVGDFDNDGWVDVIVARYAGPDLLLRNRGDGTFHRPVNAGFRRKVGVPGDMVTAADLDEDGRLDIVLSEGSWYDSTVASWGKRAGPGTYRIMRNTSPNIGNYLLVHVRNSPSRRITSLHATVTLAFKNEAGLVMTRRVGNPGAAAVVSFIETVHFGLGRRTSVLKVIVQWTNGEKQVLWNVMANRKYVLGSR